MLCDYVSTNTVVNNNGKCHDSTDVEVTRCLCKLEPSNPDTMLCDYVSTNTVVNNNGKCHDSTDIEVTRYLR